LLLFSCLNFLLTAINKSETEINISSDMSSEQEIEQETYQTKMSYLKPTSRKNANEYIIVLTQTSCELLKLLEEFCPAFIRCNFPSGFFLQLYFIFHV
jgi:hypothetical protein